MALLTLKEFAEKAGMATKNISVYIARKKVVVTESGLYDDANDLNRAFLQKQVAKKALKKAVLVADTAAPATKVTPPPREEDVMVNGIKVPSYDKMDRLKRYQEILKIQHQNELFGLRKQKLTGEVLPSALLAPIIQQHNQSFTTEFKTGADEMLRLISKKKGLTNAEAAELRGQFIKIINESLHKVTERTKKEFRRIINEHSQSRGVGERS